MYNDEHRIMDAWRARTYGAVLYCSRGHISLASHEIRMHEKVRQYNKIRRGTAEFSMDIIISADDVVIAIHHYIAEDSIISSDMCLLGYGRDWSDVSQDPIDGRLRGISLMNKEEEVTK